MSARLVQRPALVQGPWLVHGAHCLLLATLGCSTRSATPGDSAHDGAVSRGDGCSLLRHVEVPLDLEGELVDPPIITPFGDRFAMIAADSVTLKKTATVAVVSWQGVDAQNEFMLNELCPDGICRNVHGTCVLATTSGGVEFQLVEQGSAASMPAYPLRLMAWDSARSEAEISPLFDARVTAITTRTDMKSSANAARALFALGNIDSTELTIAEIGAGAALVGTPESMTLPATPWDCLGIVPTEQAGAISAVTKTDDESIVIWSIRELDADANVVFETSATVPAGEALGYADCPTVVESPAGFHAQWVNAAHATIVATAARSGAPRGAPDLLALEPSPGSLAGVLDDEFLFRAGVDEEHPTFVRMNRDGTSGGPDVVLPALPPATPERRRALPQVLGVDGASLVVSYELENGRVFEALGCP